MAPKIVGNEAVDLIELAGEQAQQVDHVDALVKQHAAAGQLAFGAPGGLAEGDKLGLAVDAAQVDDLAQFAGLGDLQGVAYRIVVAVVEAVLKHQAGVFLLALDDPDDVRNVPPRRSLQYP